MVEIQDNTLYAASDVVNGQCGIGTIRAFWDTSIDEHKQAIRRHHYDENFLLDKWGNVVYPLEEMIKSRHAGGAGFVGSGFINNDTCRKAYKMFCDNARIVFQTPVRTNTNSRNYFFYAMFDNTNNPNEPGYLPTLQPKWPF